jgi:hypothetical protein
MQEVLRIVKGQMKLVPGFTEKVVTALAMPCEPRYREEHAQTRILSSISLLTATKTI